MPVFGSLQIDLGSSLLAIGFLALNMLVIDPVEWKYTSAKIKPRIRNHAPRSTREQFAWIAVSLVTAVSEEILYRAVFFGILYELTGNYWRSGIVSAFLFAIAHRHGGWLAVPSTFVVGLVLQYFVKTSGGLYLSIAIHFIHNFVNGIVYGAIWKRKSEGELTESPAADAAKIAIAAQEPD